MNPEAVIFENSYIRLLINISRFDDNWKIRDGNSKTPTLATFNRRYIAKVIFNVDAMKFLCESKLHF